MIIVIPLFVKAITITVILKLSFHHHKTFYLSAILVCQSKNLNHCFDNDDDIIKQTSYLLQLSSGKKKEILYIM